MQLSQKHVDYWKKNLTITAILMVIWFLVTYVVGYYARELQNITILGFPLPFYMGAQGALAIYVIIIGFYAWYMNRLDIETGVQEGDDE